MDDGDLGDNIQDYAEQMEAELPREYCIQNDQAHLEPSRWWFASSAFPLIAGTLGPVASAFSICSLVRPWRQHIGPGQDITTASFVADPIWLTAVNAVQLAMAIVANAFLLLNMARRVRFSVAQPLTIAGWFISSLLLIILASMTAGPLLEGLEFPRDEYVWSQAFWYGVWAAILYFTMAFLMSVTFWGAFTGHYDKDFSLTTSQRTLMLQTIMFLMYLLIGALVFSNIENWNYLDTVYWADVTLFTVGFGDYSPATNLGRALVIPYALIGIVTLGLVIASIRSMILERGRRRFSARVEERTRRRTVRTMTLRGDDMILNPICEQEEVMDSQQDLTQEDTPSTEYERRKSEFELMRNIQEKAASRRRWIALLISTSTWFALWLVGAVIFAESEKKYQQWSYFDAFYFCFTALTTIGYGDKAPVSNAGRSFFVFWSLLALPTMTVLISNAGDTVIKFITEATIQLGNITILPGDTGMKGSLKHVASRLTCGMLYRDFYTFPTQSPSEVLAYVSDPSDESAPVSREQTWDQPNGNAQGPDQSHDVENAQGSNRPKPARQPSTYTSKVRRSLSRLRDPFQELPTGTELHFLLISEIQEVAQHLKSKNPRKYSFEEWAWYLRLIGEDERDPSNHRKPRAKKSKDANKDQPHDEHNSQAVSGPFGNIHDIPDQDLKWSWVGNRSPLMGSQEESEWILHRLTNRLRESLSAERRRQMNRKPRTQERVAKSLGVAKAVNALKKELHEKREQ